MIYSAICKCAPLQNKRTGLLPVPKRLVFTPTYRARHTHMKAVSILKSGTYVHVRTHLHTTRLEQLFFFFFFFFFKCMYMHVRIQPAICMHIKPIYMYIYTERESRQMKSSSSYVSQPSTLTCVPTTFRAVIDMQIVRYAYTCIQARGRSRNLYFF